MVRRQLVDAVHEEFCVAVASVALLPWSLVVAVQSGRLGRSGAEHGDRHFQPFGEHVKRGRARFRVVARV
jgi:hypothetical protein